jgi:mannan endo-1,4-beta-mannosidase
LTGLATNNSKHILTGQHTNYWSANQMDNINALASQSGQSPAILGTDYNLGGSQENGVALSNQWLSAGGIVLLSWWPGNPNSGANSTDENNRNINFNDLLTPGTNAYNNWYASLDRLAADLKQINGTVLLRPFVEINGSWFWWGAQNPAQFIQLWQKMHDYLVNTKGVSNVLWVYNVNAGVGNYTAYYPGPQYADIVSMDSYPAGGGDAAMYQQLLGLGKPIIYAETGVISATQPGQYAGDNNAMLQAVEANFPDVVAVVVWCQNWSLSTQNGAAAFMHDSKVINRAGLPSGL